MKLEISLMMLSIPMIFADDFIDCVGQVLTDEDCAWKEGNYEKCTDWIGDGSCDSGFTLTDKNVQMFLNCKKFDYDGKDCINGEEVECMSESEGECKAPEDDEIVDCWGQVLSDEDCSVTLDNGNVLTKCQDWIGDGTCDGGQHFSDRGYGLNFNCEAFEFDGGDCEAPVEPTMEPTLAPSPVPSPQPTPTPTNFPTHDPSIHPTPNPTNLPSPVPTPAPSHDPSIHPTPLPSPFPTHNPTPSPSYDPSRHPTPSPSPMPTHQPSPTPTMEPTDAPIEEPTEDDGITWPHDDQRIVVEDIWKAFKFKNKEGDKIEFLGCDDQEVMVSRAAYVTSAKQKDAGQSYVVCEERHVVEFHATQHGKVFKAIPKTFNNLASKLPKLRLVNFHNGGLKKISSEFQRLNEVTELKVIDLSNNMIKSVSGNWLEGTTGVTNIILGTNKIKKLSKGVFTGLYELETLDLSNNKLVKVEASTFEDLVYLKSLSLAKNKIKDIEEDTFSPMEDLEYLILKTNKLTNPEAKLFAKLPSIQKIDMFKNKVTCLPVLPKESMEWSDSNDCDFCVDKREVNAKVCDLEECADTAGATACMQYKENGQCGDHFDDCQKTCECCDVDGEQRCIDSSGPNQIYCRQGPFATIMQSMCKRTCKMCQA